MPPPPSYYSQMCTYALSRMSQSHGRSAAEVAAAEFCALKMLLLNQLQSESQQAALRADMREVPWEERENGGREGEESDSGIETRGSEGECEARASESERARERESGGGEEEREIV